MRPTLLARVEKELYTSLFRLAMEDVDMFLEMKNCMSRMPWEELNGIGDGLDLSWFKSEVKRSVGSVAASQAQHLPLPSVSFPPVTLPTSGRRNLQTSQPGGTVHNDGSTNIQNIRLQEEARVPCASDADAMDIDKEDSNTVHDDRSANIRLQEEASVPSASDANAMGIDKEDSTTDPHTSSEMPIGERNVPLCQSHRLVFKSSHLKTSSKGKKRVMVENEEEREDEKNYDKEEEEEEEGEEEGEEEETVCGLTQTFS